MQDLYHQQYHTISPHVDEHMGSNADGVDELTGSRPLSGISCGLGFRVGIL